MTHLLNADALKIIVLDFFRFLLRIVGSLLSCRCLIFKVRRAFLRHFSQPSLKGARLYYHNKTRLSTLFFSFFKIFLKSFFGHYILGLHTYIKHNFDINRTYNCIFWFLKICNFCTFWLHITVIIKTTSSTSGFYHP